MFITGICVLLLIKLRWPKNESLYDTVLGKVSLLIPRKRQRYLSLFV